MDALKSELKELFLNTEAYGDAEDDLQHIFEFAIDNAKNQSDLENIKQMIFDNTRRFSHRGGVKIFDHVSVLEEIDETGIFDLINKMIFLMRLEYHHDKLLR